MGKNKKSKITVDEETRRLLDVHMICMCRKHGGLHGRVSYNDIILDLLNMNEVVL